MFSVVLKVVLLIGSVASCYKQISERKWFKYPMSFQGGSN